MKVFLGGTCNGSNWRDALTWLLKIDYFNPVVPNWTQKCYEEELRQREECDICLYVITPKMTGVYSIAEVVDDSNKRPKKTAFAVILEDDGDTFSPAQSKSLLAVANLVSENGATFYGAFANIGEASLSISKQLNLLAFFFEE